MPKDKAPEGPAVSIAGDTAVASILALLMAAAIDEVVTYDAMTAAIHRDIRGSSRTAYYLALKQARVAGLRTFVCVRNVGYRRVKPEEHVRIADTHDRRAVHELREAEVTLQVADRNYLTPTEAKVADAKLNVVQGTLLAHEKASEKALKEVEALEAARRDQERKLAQQEGLVSGNLALFRQRGA